MLISPFQSGLVVPIGSGGVVPYLRRTRSAGGVGSYSSLILSYASLVAYSRLGEASGTTAVDASGNSLDMTYTASPTLGATGAIFGDSDAAVTFNGTSQYASRTSSVLGNSP
jgi:hypothetical protein